MLPHTVEALLSSDIPVMHAPRARRRSAHRERRDMSRRRAAAAVRDKAYMRGTVHARGACREMFVAASRAHARSLRSAAYGRDICSLRRRRKRQAARVEEVPHKEHPTCRSKLTPRYAAIPHVLYARTVCLRAQERCA